MSSKIRPGVGDKIIDGYDAQRGDKIRLLEFGLTDFNTVRGMMPQAGNDVQLRLPSRQIMWILKTSDEFNEFSWYAEGLNNRPTGGRTWRTNFGHAPVQHLGPGR